MADMNRRIVGLKDRFLQFFMLQLYKSLIVFYGFFVISANVTNFVA